MMKTMLLAATSFLALGAFPLQGAGARAATLADASAQNPRSADNSPSAPAAGDGTVSGARLIEVVERGPDDHITIPYRKYRLENGLTVILHEDKSNPLVHIDVTYHVGSAREEVGKSGFAHFFEHMMFNGSKHVADEQHFGMISEAGGTLNGSTNVDLTNYYETVPSNQLERVLWLESDRMGFLLDAVTQKAFEVQRATVKNERGERVDNKPYGLVSEKANEALYPAGHPYSWPTIGYMSDLDRVNVDDLRAFFLRWYGPNNATLTIGGDLDTRQTLEWIVKYFSEIPSGPKVRPAKVKLVTLDRDRYISLKDNVTQPLLIFSWPTVRAMHEDEAALDALKDILASGVNSLLYKNLVKPGYALRASGAHVCYELACSFDVSVKPNPTKNVSLADLERMVRESFAEFEHMTVDSTVLDRIKMTGYRSAIANLQSVSGKVTWLAYYQTKFGNPNLTQADLKRYQKVTPTDVKRVFETYISNKPAVVMSVLPKDGEVAPARPDDWAKMPSQLATTVGTKGADSASRPTPETFDRTIAPPPGSALSFFVPEVWRDRTANGIPVLGSTNSETATSAIRLRIKAGHRDDPLDKLGIAALTFGMLQQGTKTMPREVLADRLQRLGVEFSLGSGTDDSTLTIAGLSENLSPALEIASQVLFDPAFDQDDFDRLKNQVLQSIVQEEDDASGMGSNAQGILLFGRENAFIRSSSGTTETVESITLDDVRRFYKDVILASPADAVVVSDLPQTEILQELEAFARWNGSAREQAAIKPFPAIDTSVIYFIEKPGADQSVIIIARRAMPWDLTGPSYRAKVTNYPLGGDFNSRINQNLREERGYTYGASSGFYAGEYGGTFQASADVRTDVTGAALKEFFTEIDRYGREGPTEEEVAFAKRSLSQSDFLSYETPGQVAGFLSNMLQHNLDPDFAGEQRAALEAMTHKEMKAIARENFDTKKLIVVIVGDPSVREQLTGFGREIVTIDADANPLS